MDAFFRSLSLFIFGVFVGSAGMLFFTPSFNVVVSRAPGALKPIEFNQGSPAVADAQPVVVAAPTPAPRPPVTAQKYPVFVQPAAPSASAAPVPAQAPSVAAEPAIDFKAIAPHLILWPASVTVKTVTTVPVLVDGKKTQDLALEAGTVLQVSKVLADGTLEVRAKGAKFAIDSALTDFSAELGKRVAELVSKGTKFDSPFPAASSAPVAAAPAPAAAPSAPSAPVVAAGPRWPQMTLAQRVDLLFGDKPVREGQPMPAPSAATVPPAEAAANPSVDAKAAEKGKDLDRKLNQLFK